MRKEPAVCFAIHAPVYTMQVCIIKFIFNLLPYVIEHILAFGKRPIFLTCFKIHIFHRTGFRIDLLYTAAEHIKVVGFVSP